MPVKQMTCLILALALSGCTIDPNDDEASESLPHFQESFELRIPDEALKPQGVPNSDGLVFNHTDCVLFVPQSEDETWQVINGTFVLEWNDSDGSEMNLTLRANDFELRVYGPMGPSPRTLEFPPINVTWVDPLRVDVHGQLPLGELAKNATAHIRFSYVGDEAWVFPGNC